ncbi:hypothetical protein JYU34_003271 [Plutella xylostella]|uniref:Uncharacterized protein n=1 Tax=Plutella xylostella TaxID=51655 RepID=A0ABQ7QZL2_PLUXY|nr:hypothetical protein JYU34_003271 [Plutella xylostella]
MRLLKKPIHANANIEGSFIIKETSHHPPRQDHGAGGALAETLCRHVAESPGCAARVYGMER